MSDEQLIRVIIGSGAVGRCAHANDRPALARNLLASLTAAGFEVVKPELGKLSAAWLADARRFPEGTRKFALDLINATSDGDRLAVVELPEPDGSLSWSACDLFEVSVTHPLLVQIGTSDNDWEPGEPIGVTVARSYAAALLAAAVAAEKAGQ